MVPAASGGRGGPLRSWQRKLSSRLNSAFGACLKAFWAGQKTAAEAAFEEKLQHFGSREEARRRGDGMGRKMTSGGPEVENAPGGGRGRGRGGGREEDDLGRKTASGGPEAENAPGGGRGKGQGRAGWPPPAGRRLADAMRKLAEGAAADASFKASFGCNTITKTIALVSVQSGKVALVKLQTYEGAAYVGTLDDTPSRFKATLARLQEELAGTGQRDGCRARRVRPALASRFAAARRRRTRGRLAFPIRCGPQFHARLHSVLLPST